MTTLPIVLQNLIENISSKNHQLEWEIHGGKDSEVVQITLTWKNQKNITNGNTGVDEATEWNRLKREEFFEGFSSDGFYPISNRTDNLENSCNEFVPIQKPKPIRQNSSSDKKDKTDDPEPICNGLENRDNLNSEPKTIKKEPAILTKLRKTSQNSKTTSNTALPKSDESEPKSTERTNEFKPKPLGKFRRSETMPSIQVNSSEKEGSERPRTKKNPFKRSKKLGKGGKLRHSMNLDCDSQTDEAHSDFEELYRDYNKRLGQQNALLNVQEVISSGTISEEENVSVKKKYKGSLSEEAATIGAKILASRRMSIKRASLNGGVKDFLEQDDEEVNLEQNAPRLDANPAVEKARKISSTSGKEVEIQMLDRLSVYNIKTENDVKTVIQTDVTDKNSDNDSIENSLNNKQKQMLENKDESNSQNNEFQPVSVILQNDIQTEEDLNKVAKPESKSESKPTEIDETVKDNRQTDGVLDSIEDKENIREKITRNADSIEVTHVNKKGDEETINETTKESLQKTNQLQKRKRGEWTSCQDCLFSGFCDEQSHKDSYMDLLLQDAEDKENNFEIECTCNVCNGGAVNNGCAYREIVRLRNNYKLFDKGNRCYCRTCVPFKYRTMCLRQELQVMRQNGEDIYKRLTDNGPDGRRLKIAMTYDYSDESSDDDIVVPRTRKR